MKSMLAVLSSIVTVFFAAVLKLKGVDYITIFCTLGIVGIVNYIHGLVSKD